MRDETGAFEKVGHGGLVLRGTTAMRAEREALRLGLEKLIDRRLSLPLRTRGRHGGTDLRNRLWVCSGLAVKGEGLASILRNLALTPSDSSVAGKAYPRTAHGRDPPP